MEGRGKLLRNHHVMLQPRAPAVVEDRDRSALDGAEPVGAPPEEEDLVLRLHLRLLRVGWVGRVGRVGVRPGVSLPAGRRRRGGGGAVLPERRRGGAGGRRAHVEEGADAERVGAREEEEVGELAPAAVVEVLRGRAAREAPGEGLVGRRGAVVFGGDSRRDAVEPRDRRRAAVLREQGFEQGFEQWLNRDSTGPGAQGGAGGQAP